MNCRLTESKINPGESLSDLAGFSLKIGRAACSFSSYRQSAISYVLCRVSLVSFSSFFFPSRVVPFVASRYDIIQVADTRAQILWQRNRVDDLSPLPLVNRNSRIEFLHLRTWNVLFCPCFFVIFCLIILSNERPYVWVYVKREMKINIFRWISNFDMYSKIEDRIFFRYSWNSVLVSRLPLVFYFIILSTVRLYWVDEMKINISRWSFRN